MHESHPNASGFRRNRVQLVLKLPSCYHRLYQSMRSAIQMTSNFYVAEALFSCSDKLLERIDLDDYCCVWNRGSTQGCVKLLKYPFSEIPSMYI